MNRVHKSVPAALPIRLDGRQVLYVNALSANTVNVESIRTEPVVIRGVPIQGNENFMRQEDGSWKSYSSTTRYGATFRRTDRDMFRNEATPAMNKSVLALMAEAVDIFVRNHPEEFPKAEAFARNNEIMRLDREIEEMSSNLDKLISKRNEVRHQEATAIEAMQEFEETRGVRP